MGWASSAALIPLRRKWRYGQDELQAIALFALTRAATTFDPARGFTFKTYAQRAIVKFVYAEMRREMRAHGFSRTAGCIRVRVPWPQAPSGDLVEFVDGAAEDVEAGLLRTERLALVLQAATPAERPVLRARFTGLKFSEIARRLGLSKTDVFRTVSRVAARARHDCRVEVLA